ncbi:hypothetical protein V500_03280 [Pseudogymnoascus sp. VKM F-4518 (FW-2643)]|nr:hypothetical protein V500_03280 [Pseudogymnoascus sp. VKM F-4518 (FW-2643)]
MGQDASGTAEDACKSSTPESVLFINMTDQSQASQASNRKKARSHIMNRRHRREARNSSTLEPSHNAPASEIPRVALGIEDIQPAGVTEMTSRGMAPTVNGVVSPLSQMNYHHRGRCTHPENWNSLAEVHESQVATSINRLKAPELVRLGMLSTLPFQLDHRDQNLLFHYNTVFIYTNMPVNSKVEWMKFAITDAALLHMTLVISALHVALLRGKAFSVDAFRHQREAVKILDARLNDPMLNNTDPTILAISCLALTEILNASPLEAASHLNALEELVKQRGGLQALGFNGIVRRKVLWADLSSAISQQIPPRFPYSSEILPLAFPSDVQITVNTPAATICTAEVSNLVSASHYPSDICTIIYDLQYLSLVLSCSKRTDITKIDQLMLSDRFYAIERRTYDLLQAEVRCQRNAAISADVADDSIGIPSSLYTACCLTALIYVSLALREIPPRAGFFNTPVERLTRVVQDIDIVKACTAYPKTLLWILGTGGAAALGRKQRGWYVTQLADFCQERKMYEWNVMRVALGNPMDLAPEYMKGFMDVWNEVEELRIMRNLT